MKQLLCLVILLPLLSNTQTIATHQQYSENSGIKWTEGLSWEQVKVKAKNENKYIFLDIYATWCGPCKKMDKTVYSNDTVGTYFKDRFISVKVQTDKTKNDNEQIKSWYQDAATIAKKFKAITLPTYVFLSPEGIIVHKETGFKKVFDFIVVAKTALEPHKIYNDPYEEYDQLVKDFYKGNNYSKMPYIVRTALELNDTSVYRTVFATYRDYMLSLKGQEIYTRENIEFFSRFTTSSRSRLFSLFYPDGHKVDSVMKRKGFSQSIVDVIIQNEDIEKYLKLSDLPTYNVTPKNLSVPNWKKIYKSIKRKYNTSYAKRNVLDAKIIWFARHAMHSSSADYAILKINKYGIDSTDSTGMGEAMANRSAWDIFLHSSNLKQLNAAIRWMEGVVRRTQEDSYTDTYANLLYKAGKKDEAIQWEERALKLASEIRKINLYKQTLNKMRNNEPTWTKF